MSAFSTPVVSKGNCGVPKFVGTTITYSGTPELMATYAELAIDAGVRIVGGCCGNSPEHVASMRKAIDGHTRVSAPSVEQIVNQLGPLTNTVPTESDTSTRDARRRRTKIEE
jgi:5-methyltetrahydrofolate--homocysteine methyltransferase